MFRLSIREWGLLVLCIGLSLGWFLDHRQSRSVIHKVDLLREALQDLLYKYEEETGSRRGIMLSDGEFLEAKKPPPGAILSGSS